MIFTANGPGERIRGHNSTKFCGDCPPRHTERWEGHRQGAHRAGKEMKSFLFGLLLVGIGSWDIYRGESGLRAIMSWLQK